ncbi:MAG: hypothetical protein KGL18_08395 [Burkholderiales bacterium]|nr:hypothetical protein [Burkholderiales bacterium]MDE1925900.1 hypothetical protein [Burkholderiales bacterium]MDE2502978.1 hypothetical protein [Burkholderiales bacterium]
MDKRDLARHFKFDRRLLPLVGIGALIIATELGMRVWDSHQKLDAEIARLRGQAALLAASNDAQDWQARTRSVDARRLTLQKRLWQAPTQAQAQARLRDWLTVALRTAEVPRPSVSLLPLLPAPAASAAALSTLRVRATVGFDLMPKALENALVQIEGGGQLARIDSLSVQARTRHVEMVVSVPVLLTSQEPR